MLRRTHVEPFLRESDGELRVDFLGDPDGRVVEFLDRLCVLVRRLEGRPRRVVREALRRQERRVRDARRLAGVSKALLDLCEFRSPEGAERAPEVREALFRARGDRWPPTPGDLDLPYADAAAALDLPADEVRRLLYADRPTARVLRRAPGLEGRRLLDRYNLELARAVLLGATRMTVAAAGGWRGIFRAVKLARLMYRIEPAGASGSLPAGGGGEAGGRTADGRGATDPGASEPGATGPGDGRRRYLVELSGPASPYVVRAERYGVRFARLLPALVRAPGWWLEATVAREDRRLRYVLDERRLPRSGPGSRDGDEGGSRHADADGLGAAYDSGWERALAEEFAAKLGEERDGWTLHREERPLAVGGELFLPDFTLRHADAREALVEIVGFWTPEYLEAKLRKVREAGLAHLILVVYRGLAAGAEGEAVRRKIEETAAGPVLWFANRPRIGPVMEATEKVALRGAGTAAATSPSPSPHRPLPSDPSRRGGSGHAGT